MNNFDFHNPTRVLFGKGRIADLKDQVPADAKVLREVYKRANDSDIYTKWHALSAVRLA